MNYKRLLLFFFLIALSEVSIAQPLRRDRTPLLLQTGVSIEQYTDSTHILTLSGYSNWTQEASRQIPNTAWSQWGILARYEHWLSNHWAIGGQYTSDQISQSRQNTWAGYGMHTGVIGKDRSWFFIKKLVIGRTSYVNSNRDNQWQAVGYAYLGKRVALRERAVQLGVSYQVQKLWPTISDSRRLSASSLKVRADMPFGNKIMASVFAQWDTQYFFALAQDRYNADGELIESVPYHKLNRISPFVGVQVRYILRKEQAGHFMPLIF